MKIMSSLSLSFLICKMEVQMLSIKFRLRIKVFVFGKALHGYEMPENCMVLLLLGGTKELEMNEEWR